MTFDVGWPGYLIWVLLPRIIIEGKSTGKNFILQPSLFSTYFDHVFLLPADFECLSSDISRRSGAVKSMPLSPIQLRILEDDLVSYVMQ